MRAAIPEKLLQVCKTQQLLGCCLALLHRRGIHRCYKSSVVEGYKVVPENGSRTTGYGTARALGTVIDIASNARLWSYTGANELQAIKL
jgi:hypothetical protein